MYSLFYETAKYYIFLAFQKGQIWGWRNIGTNICVDRQLAPRPKKYPRKNEGGCHFYTAHACCQCPHLVWIAVRSLLYSFIIFFPQRPTFQLIVSSPPPPLHPSHYPTALTPSPSPQEFPVGNPRICPFLCIRHLCNVYTRTVSPSLTPKSCSLS